MLLNAVREKNIYKLRDKGELLDKFELGDVMEDNAESHNDPYGEEDEEGLEEIHNDDDN